MYLSVTPELKTTVNVALSFVFVVDAVYMCVNAAVCRSELLSDQFIGSGNRHSSDV